MKIQLTVVTFLVSLTCLFNMPNIYIYIGTIVSNTLAIYILSGLLNKDNKVQSKLMLCVFLVFIFILTTFSFSVIGFYPSFLMYPYYDYVSFLSYNFIACSFLLTLIVTIYSYFLYIFLRSDNSLVLKLLSSIFIVAAIGVAVFIINRVGPNNWGCGGDGIMYSKEENFNTISYKNSITGAQFNFDKYLLYSKYVSGANDCGRYDAINIPWYIIYNGSKELPH